MGEHIPVGHVKDQPEELARRIRARVKSRQRNHGTPATQPGVRMLADGPAAMVDEHRTHQLQCGGNGVVPLQAALGIVTLLGRLGMRADMNCNHKEKPNEW